MPGSATFVPEEDPFDKITKVLAVGAELAKARQAGKAATAEAERETRKQNIDIYKIESERAVKAQEAESAQAKIKSELTEKKFDTFMTVIGAAGSKNERGELAGPFMLRSVLRGMSQDPDIAQAAPWIQGLDVEASVLEFSKRQELQDKLNFLKETAREPTPSSEMREARTEAMLDILELLRKNSTDETQDALDKRVSPLVGERPQAGIRAANPLNSLSMLLGPLGSAAIKHASEAIGRRKKKTVEDVIREVIGE